MRKRRYRLASGLLGLHLALLILAASSFTAVSWIWGGTSWMFQFFRFAWSSGWGTPYESEYSLGVVLTYLLAYACGMAGYWNTGDRLPPLVTTLGLLLCGAGLFSFTVEISHWIGNHNLSLIALVQVVSLVLACGALARLLQIRLIPSAPAPAERSRPS